jgi:hypothetical protein
VVVVPAEPATWQGDDGITPLRLLDCILTGERVQVIIAFVPYAMLSSLILKRAERTGVTHQRYHFGRITSPVAWQLRGKVLSPESLDKIRQHVASYRGPVPLIKMPKG